MTSLHAMPLEGKIVSLDARLLQRSVIKTIEAKGAYIGSVKGNHGLVHALVADRVQRDGVDHQPPNHVQVSKRHERIERRDL